MNDIRWNRIILNDFKFNALLTEDELAVLHDWAHGQSTTYTAMHRNMSPSRVDKIRNQIRQKYDDVQPYSPLLPPREKR